MLNRRYAYLSFCEIKCVCMVHICYHHCSKTQQHLKPFPHSIKLDVVFAAAHLLRVTLKAHKCQHRVQEDRLEGLDDMQSFAVFQCGGLCLQRREKAILLSRTSITSNVPILSFQFS